MDRSVPASRDPAVDSLRGLAVAVMVLGHLASRISAPDGSRYVEVVGGAAAPLFLTVVGMMVARSIRAGRPGAHFVRRGALVLAAGVLVDVLVVGIRPFTSMDVLYLIGVAIPAAWLAGTRVPGRALPVLALVVVFAAPFLQDRLGYADYPTEILRGGRVAEAVDVPGVGEVPIAHRTGIVNHWLVDGWFPLFPWLGFVLLGVALGRRRWDAGELRRFGVRDSLLPGLLLLAAALAGGWLSGDWTPTPRNRYGGAFMPPRADYLAASVGLVLAVGWLIDRAAPKALVNALALPGRHALVLYVAHAPLVRVAEKLWGHRVGQGAYLATGAVLLALLAAVAHALETRRRPPAAAHPVTREGPPARGPARADPAARRGVRERRTIRTRSASRPPRA